MDSLPGNPAVVASVDASTPRFDERRDNTARVVRDRLGERLGVHPSELAGMGMDTCTRALANLNLQFERLTQLEELAAVDELTGVLRRGHGMAALAREVRRATRENDPRLVVAFIDIDGLKWFNDHAGHAEGDRLLVELTQAVTKRLRSHDLVFRYGGDEFVAILPGANIEGALPVFEAIADSFEQEVPGCSFSVGFSTLLDDDTAESLLARADAALYVRRSSDRQVEPPGFATEVADPQPGEHTGT